MTDLDMAHYLQTRGDLDLVGAIGVVLSEAGEPLTLARIKAALPERWQTLDGETLADVLERQIAANVFFLYPRYRGPHERYGHLSPRVHLRHLVREVLRAGPLPWNDIRRRLPEYAKMQAEGVVEDMIASGELFRHPPPGPRMGPRFGLIPADVRTYLRPELEAVFRRLESMGLGRDQLRAAAFELLHDSEWSDPLRCRPQENWRQEPAFSPGDDRPMTSDL